MFTSGDTVLQSPRHQPPGKLEVPLIAEKLFLYFFKLSCRVLVLVCECRFKPQAPFTVSKLGILSCAEIGKFDR